MDPVSPVDVLVAAVLGIAVLRGLFLGLVRESFSIAALGAACVAVKVFHEPLAAWLVAVSDGRVGELVAPWLAGAFAALASIGAVVAIGRIVRRGVRWAGLGWADRAGGAVLGAAEGALVAGILLLLAASVLGRGHPALADARSFDALEELERIAQGEGPAVAAPPPRS